ncbi:hypothetical protein [Pseudomonas fluorescens]|uniref:Uncharacterized protein n=1 Tax=Pseudomonas fluorescens TaxID=294 RepID=A0A5E7BXS0_PSEFL|nr:hypothetical protein [Pseudomonas fluorescens]VVN96998.1 hypothetical protein PS833_02330 [Pseudomonas fluorescens]
MNLPKFIMLLSMIAIVWLLLVYGVTQWYEPNEETPPTSEREVFKHRE